MMTDGNLSSPLPPSHDVNAPDLYIPLMAFVTYVILFANYYLLSKVLFVAFFMGTQFSFTPDVLGMTASSGFLVLGIEVRSSSKFKTFADPRWLFYGCASCYSISAASRSLSSLAIAVTSL